MKLIDSSLLFGLTILFSLSIYFLLTCKFGSRNRHDDREVERNREPDEKVCTCGELGIYSYGIEQHELAQGGCGHRNPGCCHECGGSVEPTVLQKSGNEQHRNNLREYGGGFGGHGTDSMAVVPPG